MSFYVEIQDIIVEVILSEDIISYDLVEDHIDVELLEDILQVQLLEDSIYIDLIEDHIDVDLDDSCICLPGGGEGELSTEVYNSDGSLLVGDRVYISSTLDKFVLRAGDNNTVNPIIGIVVSKSSLTTVLVAHTGFFTINNSNLRPGSKVFVDPMGNLVSDVPIINFIQVLGVAVDINRFYLKPEYIRCRRLNLAEV